MGQVLGHDGRDQVPPERNKEHSVSAPTPQQVVEATIEVIYTTRNKSSKQIVVDVFTPRSWKASSGCRRYRRGSTAMHRGADCRRSHDAGRGRKRRLGQDCRNRWNGPLHQGG